MSEASGGRWARLEPDAIPSKSKLPELEAFVQSLRAEGLEGSRLLDLGCGTGAVAAKLRDAGFAVCGVDINPRAIELARAAVPAARFFVRDLVAPGGIDLDEPPFRVVVCQLVISVVGGPSARRTLLENAFSRLEPGGRLYLSASGLSGDVNEGYARLYERDFPRTGERGTYFSRDERGEVLYVTHHFEVEELRELLEAAGFEEISIARKLESSSRRPEEAAFFLYATARRSL